MQAYVEDVFATFSTGGIKRISLKTGVIEEHYTAKDDASILFQTCTPVGVSSLLAAVQQQRAALNIWDLHGGAPQRLPLPQKLTSICFTSDGRIAIAGSQTGMLLIWQMSNGRLLNSFKVHFSAITCCCVFFNDAVVVTASADSYAKAFYTTSICDTTRESGVPQAVQTWRGHTAPIVSFVGATDGPFSPQCCFASASTDGCIMFWGWNTNKLISKLRLPVKVNCLAMGGTRSAVFAGCDDGNIYSLPIVDVVNRSNNAVIHKTSQSHEETHFETLSGHRSGVRSCVVTFDSDSLISCANDGLRIWSLSAMVLTRHVAFAGEEVLSLTLINVTIDRHPFSFKAFQQSVTDEVKSFTVLKEMKFNDFTECSQSALHNCIQLPSLFHPEEKAYFLQYYKLLQEDSTLLSNGEEEDAVVTLQKQNTKLKQLLNALYTEKTNHPLQPSS